MTEPAAGSSRRRRAAGAAAVLPARVIGRLLGVLIGAIRRVRSPRPIHRVGIVLEGRIESAGSGDPGAPSSGIAWVDATAPGRIRARLSRGIGLPVPVPDVWGLAFRQVREGENLGAPASGDVLLATVAGAGGLRRFVPLVRLSPWGAAFTTVMPYRSTRGPVLVSARTLSGAPASATTVGQARELGRNPWILQLLWATPRGPWRTFATLSLSVPDGVAVDDDDLRFDPLASPPTGAGTYTWTRALRERSYRAARRD